MSQRDLSEYYILQKLPDGWMMAHLERQIETFIPNSELIEFGYLPQRKPNVVLSKPVSSPVIQIPVYQSGKPILSVKSTKPVRILRRSDPVISVIPIHESEELSGTQNIRKSRSSSSSSESS